MAGGARAKAVVLSDINVEYPFKNRFGLLFIASNVRISQFWPFKFELNETVKVKSRIIVVILCIDNLTPGMGKHLIFVDFEVI
jgi:hypothetical protein